MKITTIFASLLMLVCLTIGASTASAQFQCDPNATVISGYIISPNGGATRGTSVQALIGSTVIASATSDSSGFYQLNVQPCNSYTFQLSGKTGNERYYLTNEATTPRHQVYLIPSSQTVNAVNWFQISGSCTTSSGTVSGVVTDLYSGQPVSGLYAWAHMTSGNWAYQRVDYITPNLSVPGQYVLSNLLPCVNYTIFITNADNPNYTSAMVVDPQQRYINTENYTYSENFIVFQP